jgi:HAD superfamily hydrolase (TIGR01484 family)
LFFFRHENSIIKGEIALKFKLMKKPFRDKKVFIFDLDGTLAKSKRPLSARILKPLSKLVKNRKVVIIGGGKFAVIKKQVLTPLSGYRMELRNLLIFPTNGAALFMYGNKGGWRKVYEIKLSKREILKIRVAFREALKTAGFNYPKRRFGSILEDRGTQVTFSALGQRTPLSLKERWNRDSDIRPKIIGYLERKLSGFEIRQGGLTSIDVTKAGIDKGYAILKALKILGIKKKDAVFFGDAIFPGGNDYSAKRAGVDYIKVSGPEEIQKLLGKLS